MIPTLILFGVVFGQWWRWTLSAAAIGWPILLLATDAIHPGWALLGVAVLAVVNTVVGVLIYQGVRCCLRYVLRRHQARWTGRASPADLPPGRT